MAIFHFHALLLQRGDKQPLLSKVAYHAGTPLCDHQTHRRYGIGQSRPVVESTILLPDRHPSHFATRERLWNAVTACSLSKSSYTAMVIQLIMPDELSNTENWLLAQRYLHRSFTQQGLAADTILRWLTVGANRHPVLHVMIPLFFLDEFGYTLPYDNLHATQLISRCRRRWIRHANCTLKRAGHKKMQVAPSVSTNRFIDAIK